MKSFVFYATYATPRGNVGRVQWTITADDIETAHDEGVARVERRKAYCGKLDAQTMEI